MRSELFPDLAAPVQGQVYLVAHSTTAARYGIPPQWRGQMVTFTSTQSDLFVLFGDANVKIEAAEAAVAVGEVLAANWASGQAVPAGGSMSFPVPDDATHFCVDSSAALGVWTAAVSSGFPSLSGEDLDMNRFGMPLLWLDPSRRDLVTVTAGAVTVPSIRCRARGYVFSEGTNMPDLIDAAAAGTGLIRPALSFVAGSSEKLVCTDAALAAALGGTSSFTLVLALRRAATGAAHTVFSVGTGGSNNGRWDFTLNASDDPVITRVTSGGSSTTSTVADTVNGMNTWVITFDGSTPLQWKDNTSQTLTGTAAGDVGTPTKVAIGCRAYNTSTADQFATMELADVMVFGEAFTGKKLTDFQAFLRRRYGK